MICTLILLCCVWCIVIDAQSVTIAAYARQVIVQRQFLNDKFVGEYEWRAPERAAGPPDSTLRSNATTEAHLIEGKSVETARTPYYVRCFVVLKLSQNLDRHRRWSRMHLILQR